MAFGEGTTGIRLQSGDPSGRRGTSPRGISGIDDEGGDLYHSTVVKLQVVRENQHAVGRREFLIAEPDGLDHLPAEDDRGDIGIRVPDLRPALLELREHLE